MIALTFGIEDSLALPQRVNLSLELGTLVWFSLSLIPKVALKTLDFKLSFRFPPPQVIGLNVVVGGWGVGRGGFLFLSLRGPNYQILGPY